jgi:putative transposase
MHTRPSIHLYRRHRFSTAIISHGVWLSCRVCLSSRDVEELMAARGIMLIYEAVRYGCRQFGQVSAKQLRRRRPRPRDTRHLDEVYLTVKGQRHDRWHAVD